MFFRIFATENTILKQINKNATLDVIRNPNKQKVTGGADNKMLVKDAINEYE